MKPEKLKSGNWRCKVYIGTDENGKKLFKSITAPTRKEAIAKAAELALDDKKINEGSKKTVGYCIDAYISDKEPELSPHTAYGYKRMALLRYDLIRDIPLSEFNLRDVQRFVSHMSGLSEKTKRNALGLLTAAMHYFEKPIDTKNITIGKDDKQKIKAPSHEQVAELLQTDDEELKMAIALGALCGLRRGEIFALQKSNIDINKKQIHVCGALKNPVGERDIREPKTEASNRVVDMPDLVSVIVEKHLDNEDGFLFKCPMRTVMSRWEKHKNNIGYRQIRFHDLRHYYASALIAAGIPDIYAMKMGGWSTPDTLKRVYQDTFADQYEKEKNKINNIFNDNFK